MSDLSVNVSEFLKVLGDQTRLDILELLKNGGKTSKEIQDALHKSQSTISLQLKKLADEDLISFEKREILKNEKDSEEKVVSINYYYVKYEYIYKILTLIQSFLITLQKEKVKRLTDLDRYDTLL